MGCEKSRLLATLKTDMLASLKDLALTLMPEAGSNLFGKLYVIHKCTSEASSHCFDKPLVALTIQGRKRIQAGPYEFRLKAGSCLVTSVDMPSISTLFDISEAQPYLGFYIRLDGMILTDLISEIPLPASMEGYCASAWADTADLEILDSFRRLATSVLNNEPKALIDMFIKEIHCILLLQRQGGILRQLYMNGARDSRIADVIGWLRKNVAESVSMVQLAKMAHMSVSSFHRHFKEITGSSPLQYHKKLRLYEAQRLMLGENQRAADAAMAVGYESVSQFNREYRRMFGEPPRRDITNRKRKLSS